MTTLFRAPFGECFIANPIATTFPLGGAGHMSKCDNQASQMWRIEPF